MNRFLLSLISAMLIFSTVACSSGGNDSGTADTDASTVSGVTEDFEASEDEMFTNRDLDGSYSENGAVKISLEGASATSSSPKVKIEGSTVTLSSEGTYIFSGTLDDGSILVDAPEAAKIQIVLDGAKVTSSTSAALLVRGGDKVFVTLAEGSDNVLENGGRFPIDDEGIDGAVFSRQDITFNGNGKLSIVSPEGHGIVAKDDLVFASGSFDILAASHGADANDSIRIKEAELAITSGKDGLHAENKDDTALGFVYIAGGKLSVESEDDGISAGAHLQIESGRFDITAGGGSENENEATGSMKGIKAQSGVLVNGGDFDVDSADDAIHSDSEVTINGGNMVIASGDGGIHAETTITVTAGDIKIARCHEGLEGDDVRILGGNVDLTSANDQG